MRCIVLQKYAATQKMTGNEQARSGHFCLCGYAAGAALTAKAVISGAGTASMFGYETMQVWGRPAAKAEDCEAIPKKSDRWLIEFTRIRQLSAFSWPQTTLCSPHRLNWRKLPESVSKPIRPLESRGRRPLAQSSRPRRPRTSPSPLQISVFTFQTH